MSDVKKAPRKISCLPCRDKKARCDVQRPHCNRCIRNKREHLCVYPKPRVFGRPPKNAISHKNKDPFSWNYDNQKQCREFIFENSNDTDQQTQLILGDDIYIPQRYVKYNNHILDIERIFSLYVHRGTSLRQKLAEYQVIPLSKQKSFHELHSWITTSMVNITIKRSCQLFNIHSFFDPELTMNAFVKPEQIKTFFFHSPSSNNNPLNSIPTHQAINLFDTFFQLYPFQIFLNKTRFLQDYWNDSVEPLLLCVVFGISTFTSQQTTSKTNTRICDIERNPFLNYAYILLEKLFSHKNNNLLCSSLEKYQALVILGIFEVLFGLPKHGMTVISLSYMMAVDLGIFIQNNSTNIIDGIVINENPSKQSSPRTIDLLDAVDRELLINTYWGALRATAYGCLELGLYLRDTLLLHGQPFPAANANASASYHLDLLNNNHTTSSPYHIESFHTEMIITFFSSKLFACLPKSEYNLFGYKTFPPPPLNLQEQNRLQTHQMLVQLLQNAALTSSSYDSTIDSKVQLVLNDFSDFILQEKHQWSFQQNYIIETTYYLYCIHFSFIKSSNSANPIRYQQILAGLDLSNTNVKTRISNLQPTTLLLIQSLQTFLKQADNLKEDAMIVLPFGLISTALETMVEMTIYHFKFGTSPYTIHDQIKSVYNLIKHPIFWTPQQQPITNLIFKHFKEFLKVNQIPLSTMKSWTNDTETNILLDISQPSDILYNATNIEDSLNLDNISLLYMNEDLINIFDNTNLDIISNDNINLQLTFNLDESSNHLV